MNFKIASAGLAMFALSACGPSAGGNPFQPSPKPGFNSNGKLVSSNPKMAQTSNSPVDLSNVALTLTTQGNVNDFSLNYAGTDVPISKSGGTYTGSAGTISATFTPTKTTSEQELIAGKLTITDSAGADFDGFAVFGWKTESRQVDQLAGSAVVHSGGARLDIYRDNGQNTFTSGDLTMTANFANGTIQGTMFNIVDAGGSDIDYMQIGGGTHHVIFGSANINGNGFSGSFSMDNPGDFSMIGVGSNAQYSGNFYQQFGDAVAGTLNSNNATYSGGNAVIVGGFIADR